MPTIELHWNEQTGTNANELYDGATEEKIFVNSSEKFRVHTFLPILDFLISNLTKPMESFNYWTFIYIF